MPRHRCQGNKCDLALLHQDEFSVLFCMPADEELGEEEVSAVLFLAQNTKYSHSFHPLKNQPNPISSLQYTHLSEYLILFDTVRTADIRSYKEKTDTKV